MKNFIKYVIKNKWLYVFLIPGMTYLFIFRYLPMYGIIIAFEDFSPIKGIKKSEWVGLDNFKYLLNSIDFLIVFRNSILLSLLRLIFSFPAPLLLAVMINEVRNMKFKRSIQTIVYLPHFISWVVISSLVISFLSPYNGFVNFILNKVGIESIPFLQKEEYFRGILIVSGIRSKTVLKSIFGLPVII